MLFRLAAAGRLQVRRMEYIGGRYRVADVPLVEGAEAAIGIED